MDNNKIKISNTITPTELYQFLLNYTIFTFTFDDNLHANIRVKWSQLEV